MRMISTLAVALVAALSTSAFAANAQQEKMAACNKDATAKSLKGEERKSFMSGCLKASSAATAPVASAAASKPAAAASKPATQQDKMKACNQEAGAKSLKGDERKKFMSECLKK